MSDLYLEENDIGPLFRYYRLRGVKVRFLYSRNVNTGTTNGDLGFMYWVRNSSNTPTGTAVQNYLNANCAIRRLQY